MNKKYLDYVNIRQGTDSQARFSNGNTLPLTCLPHAHAMFAPQTNNHVCAADEQLQGGMVLSPRRQEFRGDTPYAPGKPVGE